MCQKCLISLVIFTVITGRKFRDPSWCPLNRGRLDTGFTVNLACEQALGLGVSVFVGGRGSGEGKERKLAAMSQKFECLR